MPMHAGEEPVKLVSRYAVAFLENSWRKEYLNQIPFEYWDIATTNFDDWFSENQDSEWEALGNMGEDAQETCVLMEAVLAVAREEANDDDRARYLAILNEELKGKETIGEDYLLGTDDGFADLWLVLTEPRVSKLNHLESFRIWDIDAFKQALKQSAGKKPLLASMTALVSQYGHVSYFSDEDAAKNELKTYKKTGAKGKYAIESRRVDPVTGKTKRKTVLSRHIVR